MKLQRMKNISTILCLSVLSCLVTFGQTKESLIYDVAVVGGGPAGIGAALASAKTGAHTILIERDYRIGGTTVQADFSPVFWMTRYWNKLQCILLKMEI